MTIPNINGKMIGDIAVKTVTTCAGLWATGFWVGWGFRSGTRQSDMIQMTRDIRRKNDALEEAQHRLEKVKERIDKLNEGGEISLKECDKVVNDIQDIYSKLSAVYTVCGGDDIAIEEMLLELQGIMNSFEADEEVEEAQK